MAPVATEPTPLAGRWEIDSDRNATKVNRIRYPEPNRLGLTTPTAGRT